MKKTIYITLLSISALIVGIFIVFNSSPDGRTIESREEQLAIIVWNIKDFQQDKEKEGIVYKRLFMEI